MDYRFHRSRRHGSHGYRSDDYFFGDDGNSGYFDDYVFSSDDDDDDDGWTHSHQTDEEHAYRNNEEDFWARSFRSRHRHKSHRNPGHDRHDAFHSPPKRPTNNPSPGEESFYIPGTDPYDHDNRSDNSPYRRVFANNGTPYPSCTQAELDVLQSEWLSIFSSEYRPFPQPSLATRVVLRYKTLCGEGVQRATEAAAALARVKALQGEKADRDIVFKSFNDWDAALFHGTLRNRVYLCWTNSHVEEYRYNGYAETTLREKRSITDDGHPRQRIRIMLNAARLTGSSSLLWGVLLHQMVLAYLLIRCGKIEDDYTRKHATVCMLAEIDRVLEGKVRLTDPVQEAVDFLRAQDRLEQDRQQKQRQGDKERNEHEKQRERAKEKRQYNWQYYGEPTGGGYSRGSTNSQGFYPNGGTGAGQSGADDFWGRYRARFDFGGEASNPHRDHHDYSGADEDFLDAGGPYSYGPFPGDGLGGNRRSQFKGKSRAGPEQPPHPDSTPRRPHSPPPHHGGQFGGGYSRARSNTDNPRQPPPPGAATNERPVDLYGILGVSRNATDEQIRAAVKKLAVKHHPDKAKPEDREAANKRMAEINFAKDVLLDKTLRPLYDETGKTTVAEAAAARERAWGQGW